MSLHAHEDPVIVGFDMGFALVQSEGKVERYRLSIRPSGGIHAEPAPEADHASVDQLGSTTDPDLRARRWADIDQPIT